MSLRRSLVWQNWLLHLLEIVVVATNDLFFDTIVVYVTALQYWNTSGLSFLRPSRLLCVFAQLVVVDGWLRCRVTQFGVNAWRTISVVSDDKPHNYTRMITRIHPSVLVWCPSLLILPFAGLILFPAWHWPWDVALGTKEFLSFKELWNME